MPSTYSLQFRPAANSTAIRSGTQSTPLSGISARVNKHWQDLSDRFTGLARPIEHFYQYKILLSGNGLSEGSVVVVETDDDKNVTIHPVNLDWLELSINQDTLEDAVRFTETKYPEKATMTMNLKDIPGVEQDASKYANAQLGAHFVAHINKGNSVPRDGKGIRRVTDEFVEMATSGPCASYASIPVKLETGSTTNFVLASVGSMFPYPRLIDSTSVVVCNDDDPKKIHRDSEREGWLSITRIQASKIGPAANAQPNNSVEPVDDPEANDSLVQSLADGLSSYQKWLPW
jgi:hypothetical protein